MSESRFVPGRRLAWAAAAGAPFALDFLPGAFDAVWGATLRGMSVLPRRSTESGRKDSTASPRAWRAIVVTPETRP
jgi:hypothetical protein